MIDIVLVVTAVLVTIITVAIVLFTLRVHDNCYVVREVFHLYGSEIINDSAKVDRVIKDIMTMIDQTPTIAHAKFVTATTNLIELYNNGEISTTTFGERLSKV